MNDDVPDFLQEELLKVEHLQQTLREMIEDNAHISLDKEKLIEYTHHYYALMNYQGILYTRLKLMANPELQGLMDAIVLVCDALGREDTETIEQFHQNMKNECIMGLEDLTGEDISNYDGIDVEFRWH